MVSITALPTGDITFQRLDPPYGEESGSGSLSRSWSDVRIVRNSAQFSGYSLQRVRLLLSVDLTLVSLSMSPDLLSNCFLENAGLYECFGSLDLVLFFGFGPLYMIATINRLPHSPKRCNWLF